MIVFVKLKLITPDYVLSYKLRANFLELPFLSIIPRGEERDTLKEEYRKLMLFDCITYFDGKILENMSLQFKGKCCYQFEPTNDMFTRFNSSMYQKSEQDVDDILVDNEEIYILINNRLLYYVYKFNKECKYISWFYLSRYILGGFYDGKNI